MARRALPGVVAAFLACLALATAAANGSKIEPSVNRTDPCYKDPTGASCAGFLRTDSEWTSDLQTLCAEMPFMAGCSLWQQCTTGKAKADSPYCSLPSILADICVADDMKSMYGCEAYTELCAAGSAVQQCKDVAMLPSLPTTFEMKNSIDGVCTSHAMDGCQGCTSVGRTNFRSCPEVFNLYGSLCNSMPYMPQCQAWQSFCANADVAAALPLFCTGDAADGSVSSLPPMKMWVHQSTRDIFLFREWVPNSTGQYVGLCVAMCVLGVFTQFLKAVRLRVEMSWSAKARKAALCCGLGAVSPSAASSTTSDDSAQGLNSSKDSAKGEELEGGKGCCGGPSTAAPAPPPCCGGSAAAAAAAAPPVPTSRRTPWWRRSAAPGALSVCGVQLITKDQARRNFWRASFTFVVLILDYSLMLVVMTFNIGIILAVCGGFAIGALLFGHAGEQLSTAAVRQVPAAGPSDDLEAVFVEGPTCCSGGSGCGGGGHSGGQL